MATVEMIAAGCKGDQEERISSKEKTPSVLSESNLNFSKLTPQQFGISTESFTPSSSSQRQGEETAAKCITFKEHKEHVGFQKRSVLEQPQTSKRFFFLVFRTKYLPTLSFLLQINLVSLR